MHSDARAILLGALLGVMFVVGVGLIAANWTAGTIKTASLPLEAPIMFQPK
jgi:putative Ca2+/H+ antiporter (TMEM165/GDT1 family)